MPSRPRLLALAAVLTIIPAVAAAQELKVTLLGTGTPVPAMSRFGPSILVEAGRHKLLFDAGRGAMQRLAQLRIRWQDVDGVFLTHLHSDHTLGLPDLMLSPWTLERTVPLQVYGPPGIKAMTDHLLEAYKEDIDIRTNGLEKGNRTGYRVNAHEIKPGVIYKDQNVTVKAFLVRHGSWPEAYGYRFENTDRVVVISGDTAPSPSVIENCNGCDLLLHEVYTQVGYDESKEDWRKYITNFHTSTKELAELAAKARPGLLVLYHQMFFGGDKDNEEGLLREMQQQYKGKVVSAHDLDIY